MFVYCRFYLFALAYIDAKHPNTFPFFGNAKAVLAYDNVNLDDISCVLEPAPYVADKIDLHLDKEFNEFLRLIGVANLTEQKKERLITNEVMQTKGGTIASRFSRFEPRARAVKQINKKWGLNIEVNYYDGEPTSEDAGGDENVISMDLSEVAM